MAHLLHCPYCGMNRSVVLHYNERTSHRYQSMKKRYYLLILSGVDILPLFLPQQETLFRACKWSPEHPAYLSLQIFHNAVNTVFLTDLTHVIIIYKTFFTKENANSSCYPFSWMHLIFYPGLIGPQDFRPIIKSQIMMGFNLFFAHTPGIIWHWRLCMSWVTSVASLLELVMYYTFTDA